MVPDRPPATRATLAPRSPVGLAFPSCRFDHSAERGRSATRGLTRSTPPDSAASSLDCLVMALDPFRRAFAPWRTLPRASFGDNSEQANRRHSPAPLLSASRGGRAGLSRWMLRCRTRAAPPQAVSFKHFSESPQDAIIRHRGCAPSGVRFATDVANQPRPPVELPRTMLQIIEARNGS